MSENVTSISSSRHTRSYVRRASRISGPATNKHAVQHAYKGSVNINDLSVHFSHGRETSVAVDTVNLQISPGEFVCVLGPSGCGKSTLLNTIAGFVTPSQGDVIVDGHRVSKPDPERGMVFQQHSLFPWKTVLQNVAFGPLMAGAGRREAEKIAHGFLEIVGLSAVARRYPVTLSGGMQQRVGIARALANNPSVLLMDEPFGALDAQTRSIMQENLLELWGKFGNTVVFVTHDIDEAVYLSDRIVVMSAAPGCLIADIPVNLPRPRPADIVTGHEFLVVKKRCLELIRRETLKFFAK